MTSPRTHLTQTIRWGLVGLIALPALTIGVNLPSIVQGRETLTPPPRAAAGAVLGQTHHSGMESVPAPSQAMPFDTVSSLPAQISSTQGQNLELVGHLGGNITAIAIDDQIAYTSLERELAVLDMSDPAHPVRLGYVMLSGSTSTLHVIGHYVYAMAPDNLSVVDVARPDAPRLVGSFKLPGETQRLITVADGTAYIIIDNDLQVIDVSDPTAIPEAAIYRPDDGSIKQVVIHRGYAYIGVTKYDSFGPDPSSLHIVDVSDPARPTRVGSYQSKGQIETLHLVDNQLFWVEQRTSTNEGPFNVRLIDLSDPANPVELSFYASDYSMRQGITVANDSVYFIDQQTLIVIDFSDPANPIQTGPYELSERQSRVLFVTHHYLYLSHSVDYAEAESLVQILDVSSPAAPAPVTTIKLPYSIRTTRLTDGHVYVGTNSAGLRIFDISTPTNPTEVGFYNPTGGPNFEVVGDYVYMAAGQDGLRVVDISNPAVPVDISLYATPDAINQVAAAGSHLVISLSDKTVRILDISEPTTPVEIGSYRAPEEITDIATTVDLAYLAIGPGGLQVIDISNPQTPKVVGLYKGASVSRVAVSNNTAYLVADTIHVVDVSDPTAPTQVSTYRGQGNLVDLQAARHQLYITWRGYNTAGTDIIDVSEPISPKLLGVVNENFFPGDSAGANSYGYTVGYDELQIVDISNPQHPLNVGFYNVAGSKVIVANNHIFVSSYQSGFFIFKQLPIRLPRPAVTVDQVGHFGGAANTVSIRDHYAYMGSGPEVSILDISDPTRPRRIGQFVLPGERTVTVQDITIEGSLAYVVANTALWVLDVSNPALPKAVGSIPTTAGRNTSITVAGSYAYLTQTWSSGQSGSGNVGHGFFKVVDVSDPTQPFEISTFQTSGGSGGYNSGARDVQIIEPFAYVADSEDYGLRVFDISNPAEPVEVGNAGDGVEDMVLKDGYAYVTNGYWGGFRVIDISDPTRPSTLGSYETLGRTWDIVLRDSHAYFAEDPVPQGSDPPIGDYGLRILDVSNPSMPTATGFYTTSTSISDLAVAGNHIYMTTRGALRVLDISNPAAPIEIGAYTPPPGAYDMSVANNYAYLAPEIHWGDRPKHRVVIDLSNPVAPAATGLTAAFGPETPMVNGYALVADEANLQIMDVSDPAAPVEVSSYQAPANINQIVVAEDNVYASVRNSSNNKWSLFVVDVSDPLAPVGVGNYELSSSGTNMAIIGNYLYLLTFETGLRIFDLSNPSALVEVNTVQEISGNHWTIRNSHAYLATATGLLIVDVAHPANPKITGQTGLGLFGTQWQISDLAVDDHYAYLLDDEVGLRVVDIANPVSPVEVGFLHFPGYPDSIALVADYIYVTARESGLFVFQVTPD